MRILPKLLSAAILGMSVFLNASYAQAACRQLGSYTTWLDFKPALFIWNGAVRPDPFKMTIYYQGIFGSVLVPSPSDGGIRTDVPKLENRNGDGWYGYHIATRWIASFHAFWDDDWRWYVRYCE